MTTPVRGVMPTPKGRPPVHNISRAWHTNQLFSRNLSSTNLVNASSREQLVSRTFCSIIFRTSLTLKFLGKTLKSLWLGRFVSYARQVLDMDVTEAEKIIQLQAEVFEGQFEYFKNIYVENLQETV